LEQIKVLLVIAHPVIGSGIETLLRLEQRYEVRRVASAAEAAALRDWRPNVALVDGTLLSGSTRMHIGSPTLVLSGTESDGRALLRRLPEGRGWLRKDATAAEFVKMIDGVAIAPNTQRVLGTLGLVVVVVLVLAVILLVIYLMWLALY
jgi:DNA-binding NarL/FixJ family response regulator